MRGLIKTGFALLVLAFFLIGVATSMLRAHGVSSPASREGRIVVSDPRNVGRDVRSVELNGPIDLRLRQGAIPSLVVKGERRLLGNVETVQEGENIRIGISGMLLHHRQPLQVELILPQVGNVSLHTSGDAAIDGVSGEHIQIDLHGSGSVKFAGRFKEIIAGNHGTGEMTVDTDNAERIIVRQAGAGSFTLAGSARQFNADLSGTGTLDAEHLTADVATVELKGSGSAQVHARKVAVMAVRGSGDITVHGQPAERTVSRDGAGDVSFADD